MFYGNYSPSVPDFKKKYVKSLDMKQGTRYTFQKDITLEPGRGTSTGYVQSKEQETPYLKLVEGTEGETLGSKKKAEEYQREHDFVDIQDDMGSNLRDRR